MNFLRTVAAATAALLLIGCSDTADPDGESEAAHETGTVEADEVTPEDLELEPTLDPEPTPEPEPVELSSLLLQPETLGSGWSLESSAVDPTRIAFTAACGIPDLVLGQAHDVEVARFEKDTIAVHLVYRVDDSARVANEIGAAIERCEPADEHDNTRVVPVSFAGQGVPPTDAYRITQSLQFLDDTIEFEAAWSVTQIDATTLSLLGMNANNDSGAIEDPFPMMEEAVVATFGE